MFSSSWSMPLFTFLLGMLVRRLIGKKGGILLGSLLLVLGATRLPAPTINVSHSSHSASALLVYHITCNATGTALFNLGLMIKKEGIKQWQNESKYVPIWEVRDVSTWFIYINTVMCESEKGSKSFYKCRRYLFRITYGFLISWMGL